MNLTLEIGNIAHSKSFLAEDRLSGIRKYVRF